MRLSFCVDTAVWHWCQHLCVAIEWFIVIMCDPWLWSHRQTCVLSATVTLLNAHFAVTVRQNLCRIEFCIFLPYHAYHCWLLTGSVEDADVHLTATVNVCVVRLPGCYVMNWCRLCGILTQLMQTSSRSSAVTYKAVLILTRRVCRTSSLCHLSMDSTLADHTFFRWTKKNFIIKTCYWGLCTFVYMLYCDQWSPTLLPFSDFVLLACTFHSYSTLG